MTPLTQLPLGKTGLDYVLSCLQKAGKGLCTRLLQLPLANGAAYAFVPEGTNFDRAVRFDAGGLIDGPNVDLWLADHVVTLAHNNPSGVLIFQDAWGRRPYDRSVESAAFSKEFFDASSVYYFVDARSINRETAIETIADVAGFLIVGAFVNLTVPLEDLADSTVDDDVINSLANGVQEIYVGAYDRESYVICKRP